jgi:cobalamin synthase
MRTLRGINGDALGATNQLVELAVLLLFAVGSRPMP